jgi:fibronectin type 3 domain-containing protein
MSIFKRPHNNSSETKSQTGRSPLWNPFKFSWRQYSLVASGLLILAGGIVLFAANSSNVPSASSVILGMNGIDVGQQVATTGEQAGTASARVEWDYPGGQPSWSSSPQALASYGITNYIGILNTADDTPLSSISPSAYATWALGVIQSNLQASNSTSLWEVGNEMYLKGPNDGGPADPKDYGAMYLDLYNDVQQAGLGSKVTLMFNMWGDYSPAGSSSFSQDVGGGGWLHDAVTANPGSGYSTSLANAIEHEALSVHPYGGVAATDYGQDEGSPYAIMGGPAPGDFNYYADSYCPSGCSDEQMAKDWLGSSFGTGTVPSIYVTEYGIAATPIFGNQVGYGCTTNNGTNANGALEGWSNCTSNGTNAGFDTPCSNILDGQAYVLTEAYNAMLKDPNVKGIWWYEAVDHPTDTPGPQGVIYGGSSSYDGSVYPGDAADVAGAPKPAFDAMALEEKDLQQGAALPAPSCTPPAVGSGSGTPPASPTVTMSAPAGGATVSGTTTVSANASESGGTIASVQFKLDGANLGAAVHTPVSGSTYSYSWNTTSATNASHTLTAVVTDSAGTTATSSSVTVTVNNGTKQAATVQNFTWNASTKSLSWTAYSGATNYQIAVIQNPTTTRTPTTYPFPPVSGTSYTPPVLNGQTVNYGILPETSSGSGQYAGISGATWAPEVTVSWPDTTPPSAPTGLSAAAPTSATVNLSWTASTDNIGVTQYKIYRVTGSSWGSGTTTALTTISAPAGSTVTYNDSAVSAGTAYTYEVTALDAAGNQSTHSSAATVTTPSAVDKTPPSVPQGLHSTAVTTNSISLAWSASTDTGGSGLAGYHVYRDGSLVGSPTTPSYTDTGLLAGTSYIYTVSAFDKAANGSVASSPVTVSTQGTPPNYQPPSEPTNLHSIEKAKTETSITLAWKASTDANGPGLAGYYVYRAPAGTTTYTLVASPTTTYYVNTGLKANTTYSYYVKAYDKADNVSGYHNIITVRTKRHWWQFL